MRPASEAQLCPRPDDRSRAFSALEYPQLGIPRGGLTELSGRQAMGLTSTAVSLALQTQREGELVVWIQPEGGGLFPPDLAEVGIDLDSLVVVHVPRPAGPCGLSRAAEWTLRSGAFGLVVVDLLEGVPPGPAWHARLARLAQQHATQAVLITPRRPEEGSVGPLVALRINPQRERIDPGRFLLYQHILKDKRGLHRSDLGPGPLREPRRGPWGAA